MTFWTVLVITMLNGDYMSYVVYPSEEACNAARNIVSDTLHYDHKITCIVSEIASGSVRPRPRPNH